MTCWLTISTLQILPFLTIVQQTSLREVNDLTSLLSLLILQAFRILMLLEHITLTGLHSYKRFTRPLKLGETSILLASTWLLSFTNLEIGRQTLDSGGKFSSLKKK